MIYGQISSKFSLSALCLVLLLMLIFGNGNYLLAQQPQTQSPLPAPTGYVNDYAGVIDQPTKERLEAKLKKLKDSTVPSIEFAVATVKTIDGADIFDYSLRVYRGWGIGAGGEGDNPGLLLFVSVDDRKYFTQISRDLEGDLTDGESGQIQRNILIPAFRQGQYAKGIEDTIDAYITNIAQSRNFDATAITGQTAQTRQPPRSAPRRQPQAQASLGTCCLIIAVIAIILFLASGRGGGGRGGYGGGGGFGGLLNGLLLGSLLSNAGRGGWGGGSFGGGGGWGDSGGGWGDSGGGFGGFGGGGDAGGGGSGGDW